jgi:hypothetical protein
MFETVILGGGPAGTGPLMWAAGNGLLSDWLDRGVAIVDQRAEPGGTLGHYGLNADTLGATFLECAESAGCEPWLAALRNDPRAQALDAYRLALPPLPLVGRFLERAGAALRDAVARHAHSRFIAGARVLSLQQRRDGGITADLMDTAGRRLAVHAASAVLALGGYQPANWDAIELQPGVRLSRWQHRIVASDRLLGRNGGALAAARLAGRAQPRVVILGGSHSALSAAWVLLERTPGLRLRPGALHLLYRRRPAVFYPSRAAALAEGWAFTEADVCPLTGRVHRLGGLRGDGRDLWRRLCGLGDAPREDRAVAQPLGAMSAAALRDLLDAADLIVPAFGYRLNTVPVYDADGHRIPLAQTGPAVDAEARLITVGGAVVPNLFGIGLGSGFRPWGAMAGEPSFTGQQNSLWLYQHGLGALIHEGVRIWAAQRQERAARAASGSVPFWHAPALAPLHAPPQAPVAGAA